MQTLTIASNIAVGLIAALHVYILVLEMFLWDKPAGQFGIAVIGQDIPVPGMIAREDVAAVTVQALASDKALNTTLEIFNVVAPDVNAWKKDFPKLADK